MTFEQAEQLLAEFPVIFQGLANQRINILHSGRKNCDVTSSRRSTGAHSDPTAARALTLVKIDTSVQLLVLIRKWLDYELKPQDRVLVICTWRRLSWETISKKHQMVGVRACQKNW